MTDRPRLLFLASSLGVGGIERLWSSLLPGLKAQGAEVLLVTMTTSGEAIDVIQSRGVDWTPLNEPNGLNDLRKLPSFVKIVRQFRPDAMMTFGGSSDALAALAAQLTRIPHAVNWHRQVGLEDRPRDRYSYMLAARLGSGVIAGSRLNFNDLRGLGFPSHRLKVGLTGVPGPDGARGLASRLESTGFRVCLAARLESVKRIDVFLRAMASLAREVPDAKGTVMGRGPLMDELVRLRDELRAPVEFTGLVGEPMEVMLASDVFCLTSDFETTPLALMEAAACGLPAVATDAGATSEIVLDGVTGFVTPLGDSDAIAERLRILATDRASRDRMSVAAREHWKRHHTTDAMVHDYWNLLTTIEGPPARWPSTVIPSAA